MLQKMRDLPEIFILAWVQYITMQKWEILWLEFQFLCLL